MAESRTHRNVALVGFMGAGKTTVGNILAGLLDFEFLDTDRMIEQREGCRVTEIFASRGEPHFRALESALCRELESATDKVIATGGGLAVDPDNLASLRRHALVVCLWASPEVIHERVKHQHHRPLLHTADPLGRIRELLAQRAPAYRAADVLVGVDFRSPIDTARFVAASFRRARQAGPPAGPASA